MQSYSATMIRHAHSRSIGEIVRRTHRAVLARFEALLLVGQLFWPHNRLRG
jgi:hypothetical protein